MEVRATVVAHGTVGSDGQDLDGAAARGEARGDARRSAVPVDGGDGPDDRENTKVVLRNGMVLGSDGRQAEHLAELVGEVQGLVLEAASTVAASAILGLGEHVQRGEDGHRRGSGHGDGPGILEANAGRVLFWGQGLDMRGDDYNSEGASCSILDCGRLLESAIDQGRYSWPRTETSPSKEKRECTKAHVRWKRKKEEKCGFGRVRFVVRWLFEMKYVPLRLLRKENGAKAFPTTLPRLPERSGCVRRPRSYRPTTSRTVAGDSDNSPSDIQDRAGASH